MTQELVQYLALEGILSAQEAFVSSLQKSALLYFKLGQTHVTNSLAFVCLMCVCAILLLLSFIYPVFTSMYTNTKFTDLPHAPIMHK